MNILPPLKVIKAWRDEGLSPTEVYRRCEEYTGHKKLTELRFCSKCEAIYFAKGLCRNHYNKEWYQRKKLEMLNNM